MCLIQLEKEPGLVSSAEKTVKDPEEPGLCSLSCLCTCKLHTQRGCRCSWEVTAHSSWMLSLTSRDQARQRLHLESSLNSQGGQQLIGIIRLGCCLSWREHRDQSPEPSFLHRQSWQPGGVCFAQSSERAVVLFRQPQRGQVRVCGAEWLLPVLASLDPSVLHTALSASHLYRRTQLQSAKSMLQISFLPQTSLSDKNKQEMCHSQNSQK